MNSPDSLPCAADPEAFFAHNSDSTTLKRAGTLCGACPVRTRCLDGAIARRELWGVWGGVLFDGGQPGRVLYKAPRPYAA